MSRPLTIAIAGDVMLGRMVDETIAERGVSYPWGDLLPLLRGVDLFLVNLECALTGQTRAWHDGEFKTFHFRGRPEAVQALRAGGVDYVSLANNHVCDFGAEGLLETGTLLDTAGIAHSGAGPDLASARQAARLSVDGFRVGVLSFADYPLAWAATDVSPGVNFTDVSTAAADFARVRRVIAAARRRSDLLVFSIHWGPNMRNRPSRLFQSFARRVMGSGVDVFWGHSAHLVQGIEVWEGKPILYDSGDFIDDYAVDAQERNDLSALFLLRVTPPDVERVDVIPVKIGDNQVNRATAWERAWFERRLMALSAELGTTLAPTAEGLSATVRSKVGEVRWA